VEGRTTKETAAAPGQITLGFGLDMPWGPAYKNSTGEF